MLKTENRNLSGNNICVLISFYRVYCDVEPKRNALAAANADLAAAVDKLKGIQSKIKALEETLDKLTADFERATAEKLRCQEQADSTNRTIKYVNHKNT
mgnify:CR=1 FL=1